MLPPRNYFYKDEKGNIKKFTYCCMCGEGPFKESERNYKYLSLHNKDGSNYCLKCARTLGLNLDDVIDRSSLAEKEKIEVVVFQNVDPPAETPSNTEPEEEATPKPQIKVEEVEPGPFYVYIGQFVDNMFLTGVSKDIYKDLERINSGTNPKLKKLPMELVYYHMEDTKEGAIASKEAIMLMTFNQKEDLIKKFTKEFFEK